MKTIKRLLVASLLATLFACTPTTQKPSKSAPSDLGYLKTSISQKELMNPADFKRYYYLCSNLETNESTALTTYFPLWKESRQKENFGFYFQLDGGKVEPFDHLENRSLNARGTRFEVSYRSYQPINGTPVVLVAREAGSTYYKDHNGIKTPWLKCQEN